MAPLFMVHLLGDGNKLENQHKENFMTETWRQQTGFTEVNGTRLYYEVAGTDHPQTLIHD